MVFFYLLILGIGIWASFKSKRDQQKSAGTGMEVTLLANRSISWFVGIFTMTGKHMSWHKICSRLWLRVLTQRSK